MAIKKGTLDELLSGRDPKAVFSKNGLFDELKKALAERVFNAELDDHLDGQAAAGATINRTWPWIALLVTSGATTRRPTGLPLKAHYLSKRWRPEQVLRLIQKDVRPHGQIEAA